MPVCKRCVVHPAGVGPVLHALQVSAECCAACRCRPCVARPTGVGPLLRGLQVSAVCCAACRCRAVCCAACRCRPCIARPAGVGRVLRGLQVSAVCCAACRCRPCVTRPCFSFCVCLVFLAQLQLLIPCLLAVGLRPSSHPSPPAQPSAHRSSLGLLRCETGTPYPMQELCSYAGSYSIEIDDRNPA